MKRISGLLISVLVFLLVLFGIKSLHHAPTDSILGVKTNPSITSPVTPVTNTVGTPVSLSIPSIGLTAHVESVGQDTLKRMDVPKNANDVGWYDMGFKPGEKGSAVIDGHYDTVTGAPSVFFTIKNLINGDTIKVTDEFGHEYTFVVTDKVSYPFDKVPLQQVFNTQDKPRLNLITCSGTWDKTTHNYSDRTVVFAEMKK